MLTLTPWQWQHVWFAGMYQLRRRQPAITYQLDKNYNHQSSEADWQRPPLSSEHSSPHHTYKPYRSSHRARAGWHGPVWHPLVPSIILGLRLGNIARQNEVCLHTVPIDKVQWRHWILYPWSPTTRRHIVGQAMFGTWSTIDVAIH